MHRVTPRLKTEAKLTHGACPPCCLSCAVSKERTEILYCTFNKTFDDSLFSDTLKNNRNLAEKECNVNCLWAERFYTLTALRVTQAHSFNRHMQLSFQAQPFNRLAVIVPSAYRGLPKKGAPLKIRVSYAKKLKIVREDGSSVKKYPTFVAHNFRVQIKLKSCQFCCDQFGRYGN